MLVTVAFILLVVLTFLRPEERTLVFRRSAFDWFLDLSGLVVQGVFIPGLQILLALYLYQKLVPQWHGQLRLNGPLSFFLNFLLVDYLYYWNHRALHAKALWPLHQVHHTAEEMDIFVTSRNTLWTPLFIVYVWVNSLLIFTLVNPAWFIAGAALTASLDLWRHTRLEISLPRWVRFHLMTPQNHAWHHSRDRFGINFGANVTWWDKIHGTYLEATVRPTTIGVKSTQTQLHKFLLPYGGKR